MANHPDGEVKLDSDRLRHLKLKIKAWEKDFAAGNNGTPPTREDISANVKIAARYSEYQRLKKLLLPKESQTTHTQSFPQPERKAPSSAPHKLTQTAQTPPSNPFFFTPTKRPEILGPLASPSASTIRRLKWMTKGYVSPTPQKNGKVLGLFDKLPGMTPSPPKRPREADERALLAKLTESVEKSTFSYDQNIVDSDDDAYTPLDPTTPSRKRRYEFQTPLSKKSKFTADESDPFATPAIFRQQSRNLELNENGSPVTPDLKHFLPNRGMIGKVKPLSTLVKELRELQDNQEDPGMEVLRELEQQDLNLKQHCETEDNKGNQLVQIVNEPAQTPSNHQAEDREIGEATKRPVYKKKGQKRQTKRVKMRPVRSIQAKTTLAEDSDNESRQSGSDTDTKAAATDLEEKKAEKKNAEIHVVDDCNSDGEYGLADLYEDELSAIATPESITGSKKLHQAKTKELAVSEKGKKATKVKADKYQNFTRMKMHHKGRNFKGKGKFRR
ncbi:hypothetical protein ABW20_dc0108222 [Dactylellina cionopaga]|nr:hypothetical protein ABW20_dc0108222 [Dactylellina cionopaga]